MPKGQHRLTLRAKARAIDILEAKLRRAHLWMKSEIVVSLSAKVGD